MPGREGGTLEKISSFTLAGPGEQGCVGVGRGREGRREHSWARVHGLWPAHL